MAYSWSDGGENRPSPQEVADQVKPNTAETTPPVKRSGLKEWQGQLPPGPAAPKPVTPPAASENPQPTAEAGSTGMIWDRDNK